MRPFGFQIRPFSKADPFTEFREICSEGLAITRRFSAWPEVLPPNVNKKRNFDFCLLGLGRNKQKDAPPLSKKQFIIMRLLICFILNLAFIKTPPFHPVSMLTNLST
jgi:hypothetical protein